MIEDSALTLKMNYDKGESIPIKEAQKMLRQSELINKLITPPERSPNTFAGLRGYMWRLLELCEIPFTDTLEEVQKWIKLLVDNLTSKKDSL
jgi:hypothetical protein